MSAESNKSIIQQFFAAWNAHDTPLATSLIAEQCNGGGPEGAKREFEAFFKAFPDLSVTLETILAEGDMVATRSSMRGTQATDYMGAPSRGKAAQMKAHHIFRLEGGMIVSRLGQMDRLEVMQQLGMRLVLAE